MGAGKLIIHRRATTGLHLSNAAPDKNLRQGFKIEILAHG
jgi:hypothetical protein